MAYRADHIEKFIEKVQAEAELAAQAIFDKHNDKLQEMINNQVLPGHTLSVGMGAASIHVKGRDLPYNYAERFSRVVGGTQYWKENVRAGFSLRNCDKRKVKIAGSPHR